MPQTDARRRASKKYHAKLDELKLRVPQGEGDVFRAHAATQGESLNGFLYRAAKEAMEHDQQK